jgi:hypothetical protein
LTYTRAVVKFGKDRSVKGNSGVVSAVLAVVGHGRIKHDTKSKSGGLGAWSKKTYSSEVQKRQGRLSASQTSIVEEGLGAGGYMSSSCGDSWAIGTEGEPERDYEQE